MTTCSGESCLFDLLCVSFEDVLFVVYVSFPVAVEGGMWDLIVLFPDYCLFIYFESYLADMIFTLKFTKGHNSVKTVGGVTVLIYCKCLMMFSMSTKLNISRGFGVIKVNVHTEHLQRGIIWSKM